MNKNIVWLRNKMNMLNLQGMILSNPVNIKYLTGIEAEGVLLITRKENFFITDARYIEEVQSVLTIDDGIIVNNISNLTPDDYENFFLFCENVGFEEIIILEDINLGEEEYRYMKEIISKAKYLLLNGDIDITALEEINIEKPIKIITFGFNTKATITISSVKEESVVCSDLLLCKWFILSTSSSHRCGLTLIFASLIGAMPINCKYVTSIS